MILTTGIHTELKKNTLTNQSEFVSLSRKEFRIPETRKMRGKKKKKAEKVLVFFSFKMMMRSLIVGQFGK